MPLLRLVPYLLVLVASGCGRAPEYMPMPAQRPDSGGRDPGELGNFIRMGDPLADEYIVRDVTSEKVPWRWAFARPEIKLRVKDTSNLRFVMEFVVPNVTFRDTGPIVVSCFVNDKPLGSIICPHSGEYRFEKPVPAGWVEAGKDILVRAEADKRWLSKTDGAQLSFLLGAIGFPRP